MTKPVEVWCVVDGERILAYDINAESFRNNDEMTNYRCERRLLVPVGQTFADGVEAAADKFRELMVANDGSEYFDADLVEDELRALSPAPESDAANDIRVIEARMK
jgi:hypothetical protein